MKPITWLEEKELTILTTLDNGSEKPISASLIIGRLVIKENLDKILIDSKCYTKEEVYGSN